MLTKDLLEEKYTGVLQIAFLAIKEATECAMSENGLIKADHTWRYITFHICIDRYKFNITNFRNDIPKFPFIPDRKQDGKYVFTETERNLYKEMRKAYNCTIRYCEKCIDEKITDKDLYYDLISSLERLQEAYKIAKRGALI